MELRRHKEKERREERGGRGKVTKGRGSRKITRGKKPSRGDAVA